MRPKSIVLLVVALGCGLVASIGINQVLANRSSGTGAAAETTPIFVAKKDIFTGDKLTPENVNLEEWPKSKIPLGAIATLEEMEDRRARGKFFAGEPILDMKLLAKGELSASPTDMIPPGFRAIPIRVDDEKGAAGMIGPGDRVDLQIHVNANASLGIPETETRTFLHNVKVFAVDKTVTRNEEGEQTVVAKTISLLLTPKQADIVTLATEVGKIRLVMRGTNDEETKIEDAGGAKLEDLLGKHEIDEPKKSTEPTSEPAPSNDLKNFIAQQAPPVEPQTPATPTLFKMLIIEGTNVREVELPADGALAPQSGAPASEPAATLPSPTAPALDPLAPLGGEPNSEPEPPPTAP